MNRNERIQFIQTSFPALEINQIEENNRGWDNDLIIINHHFAFRFPKNDTTAKKVIMEKQLLDILKTKAPLLKCPDYTLLYDKKEKLICTYHQYIDGVQLELSNNEVNIDDSAKLLGDFLTKVHNIQAADFKESLIPTIHTVDYWNNFYTSIKLEIYPLLEQVYRSQMDQLFQNFFHQYRNEESTKCVIHGDLTCANILYNPTHHLVTGVIDFTDAQISDPAFDFAGFYWDFGGDFTRKVLAHYDGTESVHAIYERVISFYGLQPVFHELLYAIRKGIPIDANEKINKLLQLQKTSKIG